MRKLVANFKRLLGLPKELEGLRAEQDIINSELKGLQLTYNQLSIANVNMADDFHKALKLLTEEQGASYKELRQDLNTFQELYASLEARVNTTESLLPEVLGAQMLKPVNTFHSFRARRRELEAKHTRKTVDETQPALVAEGT